MVKNYQANQKNTQIVDKIQTVYCHLEISLLETETKDKLKTEKTGCYFFPVYLPTDRLLSYTIYK